MLTRHGEFIPTEVKRRSRGLTADEVSKLDALTTALAATWSAVAVCEYAGNAESDLTSLVLRHEVDGTYKRIVLTYDHLLDPRLIWAMGDDPFVLAALTPDEIAERERSFVDGLASRADDQPRSMFEYGMLHRHKPASEPGSESAPSS
jgi:hypothetical protein